MDTLKQYKAFGKFVEWMYDKGIGKLEEANTSTITFLDCFDNCRKISHRELLSLLVEFCDSEGCWITIDADLVCDDSEEPKFSYWITALNKYDAEDAYEDSYATRTEATKAAIIKCFELMEQ